MSAGQNEHFCLILDDRYHGEISVIGEVQMETGVYTAVHKDGSRYFRSSITYRRKHISLGSFDDKKAAARAYAEASVLLCTPSMTISGYAPKFTLPFDKYIVLCNFRDNGLYISNPIYIRPRFFYYYLSPDIFFTFDQDDLFFYSSHRIMKRGGHYFISEYGMQTTLYSRYGIPSYAVIGRDFSFKNGNPYDMRSINLNVINSYYGVRRIVSSEGISYNSRIHISGYCTVGSYRTPEEAAIAYNKAVDIVRSSGIEKNYFQNYIESVSPSRYAEIYTLISVSPNISKICKRIIARKNRSC